MEPTLVLMAAGSGSRYGGLKQIEPVGPGGELIVDYSIFDAIRVGFKRVVFIIRRDIEEDFKGAIGSRFEQRIAVDYAFQSLDDLRKKPWGTGHAILCSEQLVAGPFAVMNADDFYGLESFRTLFDYLKTSRHTTRSEFALVGYPLVQTLSEHGGVARAICESRADDTLCGLREIKKIEPFEDGGQYTDEQGVAHVLPGDTTVSMNMWGFTPALFEPLQGLFRDFLERNTGDDTNEFLIPEAVSALIRRDLARVRLLRTGARWFGITYRHDRDLVSKGIAELIDRGEYPKRLWS